MPRLGAKLMTVCCDVANGATAPVDAVQVAALSVEYHAPAAPATAATTFVPSVSKENTLFVVGVVRNVHVTASVDVWIAVDVAPSALITKWVAVAQAAF